MKNIIQSKYIIIVVIIFYSCFGSSRQYQIRDNFQNVISDMKQTSWFVYGDDKRARAIKIYLLKDFMNNEYKAKQLSITNYNKMTEWINKSQAINNMKIKYINKIKQEIYGEGFFNISDHLFTTYLIYDFRLSSTPSSISIALYNWRCYYPNENIYRNFENEPQGNYSYTWPTIKSSISSILYSWENDIIR